MSTTTQLTENVSVQREEPTRTPPPNFIKATCETGDGSWLELKWNEYDEKWFVGAHQEGRSNYVHISDDDANAIAHSLLEAINSHELD